MGICYKRWSSCGSDPTSRFEAQALLATDSYQASPKFSTKKNKNLKISHPQLLNLYNLPAYQVGSKYQPTIPTTQNTHPPGARHRNLQNPDGGHMQIRNHCFVHRSDRLGFLRHWLKRKPWKPWDPWDYDVDFLSDPHKKCVFLIWSDFFLGVRPLKTHVHFCPGSKTCKTCAHLELKQPIELQAKNLSQKADFWRA